MISITVSNATLVLGSHVIFRDLNWEIQHDQKIGLIGPNGAGKSSLFKLITGEHSPEKGGAVIRAKGVSVGYLPQHPEFPPEETALALALEGTCTGEHGVGLHKMDFLRTEAGDGAVAMMRTLKRALDPDNILNPGKIFTL